MSNNFTYCECEVGTCQGADIEWCANKTVPSIKELARLRRVEAAAKAVNAAFLRGDGIMDVVIDNLSAALEEGV